jgi:hypothetical protein
LNGESDVWIVDQDNGTREVRNTLGHVLHTLPKADTAQVEGSARYPGVIFTRPRLGFAERHPRMFRACTDHTLMGQFGTFHDEWQMSRRAIKNLCLDMGEIFRRVEPDGNNADAIYGHEIRNMLALACMEVESSLKAILKVNHYPKAHKPGRPTRYDTNDYVRLHKPLRLEEYTVRLSGYANIALFAPFAGWDINDPTRSLRWYDAYNETKHDREANFKAATLLQMIHALGAAHVMMHAQFGQCAATGMGSTDQDDFYVTAHPQWPLEERYIPPSPVGTSRAHRAPVDERRLLGLSEGKVWTLAAKHAPDPRAHTLRTNLPRSYGRAGSVVRWACSRSSTTMRHHRRPPRHFATETLSP